MAENKNLKLEDVVRFLSQNEGKRENADVIDSEYLNSVSEFINSAMQKRESV